MIPDNHEHPASAASLLRRIHFVDDPVITEALSHLHEPLDEIAVDATRLLRVTGKNFCAAIVFEKREGKWIVGEMAPILRKIIGTSTQPEDIKRKLDHRKLRYEWLPKV
jgi:hypothetical protein